MARIVLEGLSAGYGGAPVVRGLSGVFAPGHATAVVGPNGGGKSTLMKALAGRIAPMAGEIVIEGAARRDIAWVPQSAGVDRDFPIALSDLVSLGFARRLGLFGGLGRREQASLAAALESVGLTGLEREPIDALSGGQFQRALFARAMVQDAPVVLLDEPFAEVDGRTLAALVPIVEAWAAEGRVVVLVAHDLDVVRRLCGSCLLLAGEAVAWGPTAAVLIQDRLEAARVVADRPTRA